MNDMLKITVDVDKFFAQMQVLYGASYEQVNKAMVSALNTVSKGFYNHGLKLVARHFAIPDVEYRYGRSVTLIKAAKNNPQLRYRAEGRTSLHLTDFDVQWEKGGKEAASVQILRKGKRHVFQKPQASEGGMRTYKAFVMPNKKSGKMLFTMRDPGTSYVDERGYVGEGLKVFFGPGIVPFLKKQENQQAMYDRVSERFFKRFERNVNALMKGYWKAGKR